MSDHAQGQPPPQAVLPAARLAALRLPAGVSLVAGGYRGPVLPLLDPPRVPLDSRHRPDQLALLAYAGLRYQQAESPAAALGLQAFATGQRLASTGAYSTISFDWDHTLSNFSVVQGIAALASARRLTTAPSARLAATPLVEVEMARPFVGEFAFGAMTGFALRQGLRSLADWESYRPQVCVATHTWADRLGLFAQHLMPLLPLMEGLLPGSPQTHARFTASDVKCVLHLQHFIDYAIALVERFDAYGIDALASREREELRGWFIDGTAHRRKPLGVWARRGFDTSALLHVDDSTRVAADHARLGATAVLVPHSHSRLFADVQEWHKVSLPSMWRPPERAVLGAGRHLAQREALHPAFVPLLRRFATGPDTVPQRLPAGVVMPVHQAWTSTGEFWRYYVEPVNRARALIRRVSQRHGGRRTLVRSCSTFADLEPT